MAIRVTQGLMYNSMHTGMNRTLSALMDSNIQSSSQKRVNKPSDDPVSSGRILNSRDILSRLSVYEENTKVAMGWLGLADNILGSGDGSVLNVLSLIKAKDIQTSTGTINQENRKQVATEIRQFMEQLIQLSNTKYGDQHIFAGQKTDKPPYGSALGVTLKDPSGGMDGVQFHVSGASEKTILISPVDTPAGGIAAGSASYMYSSDGGETWHAVAGVTATASGGCVIDTGMGVTVEISDATAMVESDYSTADFTNPSDDPIKTSGGTWLYVRPTAVYSGDDHSTQVVTGYRAAGANQSLNGEANGYFTRDVGVRLDSIDNSTSPPRMYYSYTTDNGSNWTGASVVMPVPNTDPLNLPIPGGYLTLNDASGLSGITAGDMGTQFMVHPERADVNFQIGDGDYITANMVGMEIFGGLYNDPASGYPYPGVVSGPNLFETLGKLVAGLETNDEDMVSQCLAELDDVMSVVRTKVAEVGGRENRLIVSQAALVMRSYTEEDNLSMMEDVDVTTLMTKLAQQQIAYNSVLKSSSMIMQMSLVNFL